MRVIRGGDIRQFKLNGKEFDVPSDAEMTIIPHGFQNEYSPNGNGTISGIQKRTLAELNGLQVSIDNSTGDYTFLTKTRDLGELVPVIITLADTTTWTGTLGIQGNISYNTATGVAGFDMRGSRLEQL